jgi:hypothetical protein
MEISINGRVMVDAATFQEINPNYVRPSMFKSTEGTGIWDMFNDSSDTQPDEAALKNGIDPQNLSEEDLLLCSPTVLGFALIEQVWRKTHGCPFVSRLLIPLQSSLLSLISQKSAGTRRFLSN